MRTTAVMFRRTLLVTLGLSLILAISVLFGESTRSALPILEATKMTETNYEDPFRLPHLVACDPEDVPALYAVMLKRGYALEQHMGTIGTDLRLSLDWVSAASSDSELIYTATLDNSTLAAVLRDCGVKLVECRRKSGLADTVDSIIPAQDLGHSLLWV